MKSFSASTSQYCLETSHDVVLFTYCENKQPCPAINTEIRMCPSIYVSGGDCYYLAKIYKISPFWDDGKYSPKMNALADLGTNLRLMVPSAGMAVGSKASCSFPQALWFKTKNLSWTEAGMVHLGCLRYKQKWKCESCFISCLAKRGDSWESSPQQSSQPHCPCWQVRALAFLIYLVCVYVQSHHHSQLRKSEIVKDSAAIKLWGLSM